MKPMTECKGFNMERMLVKYSHGYITVGYYKDGMIQLDGSYNWHKPTDFESYMLLKDLMPLLPPIKANESEKSDAVSINNEALLARALESERMGLLIDFILDDREWKISIDLAKKIANDYLKSINGG